MKPEINRSKAPEGATHWAEDQRCYSTGGIQFYRQSDEGWSYWGEAIGYGWRQCLKPCKPVFEIVSPKSAGWNGKGLPPVGTVCEWHPNQDGWVQVEILGHNGEETWFRREGHESSEICLRMAFFRPIRTPEQIAQQERENTISEMVRDIDLFCSGPAQENGRRALAEKLYLEGYRKQVKP